MRLTALWRLKALAATRAISAYSPNYKSAVPIWKYSFVYGNVNIFLLCSLEYYLVYSVARNVGAFHSTANNTVNQPKLSRNAS
jgi:hypothetical protein